MRTVTRKLINAVTASSEIFGTLMPSFSTTKTSHRSGLKYIRHNKVGDLMNLYYAPSFRELKIPFFFNETLYTSLDRAEKRELRGLTPTKPHDKNKAPKGKKK